jgi:hypothetical protein
MLKVVSEGHRVPLHNCNDISFKLDAGDPYAYEDAMWFFDEWGSGDLFDPAVMVHHGQEVGIATVVDF